MSKNLDKQTLTLGIVAAVVAVVLPTLAQAVTSVTPLIA
jgi:hypothetical protein